MPALQRARCRLGPRGARHPRRAAARRRNWLVDGQKVWTSNAHSARWAILLARHDPNVVKHAGLTYFVCDMTDPGVDVRPLRQITGEAEFNEVWLTGVRIPDAHRLGPVGAGWKVAQATLMNERIAIGGSASPRESGMIGVAAAAVARPARPADAGAPRPAAVAVGGRGGQPDHRPAAAAAARGRAAGAEGSANKLAFARLAQAISGLEVELRGEEGLAYDDWSCVRPGQRRLHGETTGRGAGYRYLRAKGNSIEGGTSEILRNIVAERVLGLPAEPRTDTRSRGRTCRDDDAPRPGAALDPAVATDPLADADLLYGEVEEDLRATVRGLLRDRLRPGRADPGPRRRGPARPPALGRRSPGAGLRRAARARGARRGGASAREAAVVLEELGRAVAAVPFLTSAVVATRALLASAAGPRRWTPALARLAGAEATGSPRAAAHHGARRRPGRRPSPVEGDRLQREGDERRGRGTRRRRRRAGGARRLPVLVLADRVVATARPSLDQTRRVADVTFGEVPGHRGRRGAEAVAGARAALLAGAGLMASEQLGVASGACTRRWPTSRSDGSSGGRWDRSRR